MTHVAEMPTTIFIN